MESNSRAAGGGFLAGLPGKSPDRPKRRRKKATEKSLRQLDLLQMQNSPSKPAAISPNKGQSEHEAIVIRDDNAKPARPKKSLRARSKRATETQQHPASAEADIPTITQAPDVTDSVVDDTSTKIAIEGHETEPQDADKENRSQGWILRPGAREKTKNRASRVRKSRGEKSSQPEDEKIPSIDPKASSAPEQSDSIPAVTGEQSNDTESTQAAKSGKAKKRGSDRARRQSEAEAQCPSPLAKAEGEEATSDLTTPISSQDTSLGSQDDSESGSSRRRSSRLKIKEQEKAIKAQEEKRRAEEQLTLARRNLQLDDNSDGQSSPGECVGWMWRRKAERKNRATPGRLASVKQKHSPVASLTFDSEPPEAAQSAQKEKLTLRLKVPLDLQMELQSLLGSPLKSNTRKTSPSVSSANRERAVKQHKRKRTEDVAELIERDKNEITAAKAEESGEPRNKRRRGNQQSSEQSKATPGTPTRKSKTEGTSGNDKVNSGQEFFMTKEQREAYRQAKLKEQLKKKTEESKKVDLTLTQGKSIHPFLAPRKSTPASAQTASGTSTGPALLLNLSTTISLLPLPPPVPNHVSQLTQNEKAFLCSLSATSLPLHSYDKPSVSLKNTDEDPLLFYRVADMRDRIAKEDTDSRSRGPTQAIGSGDDETAIAQLIEALQALFPLDGQPQLPSITDACFILETYRTKRTTTEASAQLWSDRYQPRCMGEIMGYNGQMMVLNTWLQRWKSKDSAEAAKPSKSRKRAKDSPGDGLNRANLLLIQGPTGVGKTATVYAAAEELGFRVLEINPSVERTGAHIKNLVEEATQSRNVATLSTFGATAEATLDISPSPPLSQGETTSARCSIVLFEEVDVVFASDKGFFSALRELLRITKTPLVLTCNSVTQDLEDLLREFKHVSLTLNGVPHIELILHLQLMCLAEGMSADKVVAQTEEVKHMVEHLGGDVRQSMLALQYWLRDGDSQFNYLSWLGLGDVAKRWSGSLTSLLLPWKERADHVSGRYDSTAHLEDRLQFANHVHISSLLHCNLFSFFPRIGTAKDETNGFVRTEEPSSQQHFVISDSGIISMTHERLLTNPPNKPTLDIEEEKSMMPIVSRLDLLCQALSFHDIVKTEFRKRKIIEHHGVDITPDALLGRQFEALQAVLEIDSIFDVCRQDHVEELVIPHTHNRQLSIRERHKENYDFVFRETVPRVQHLSRYGGLECFAIAQHIARLDARNRQAKEGRRKQRHVNSLRLKAEQHAWLLQYGFPWVSPSETVAEPDEDCAPQEGTKVEAPRDSESEAEDAEEASPLLDEAEADQKSDAEADSQPVGEAAVEHLEDDDEADSQESSSSSDEGERLPPVLLPGGNEESPFVSVEEDFGLRSGIVVADDESEDEEEESEDGDEGREE